MIAMAAPDIANQGRIRLSINARDLAWTAVAVIFSATIAGVASDLLGEVAAALILVLGITVSGAVGGLVCAMMAALVVFAIFNFAITEPVLVWRLSTGRDVAPLVVFALCAGVTGVLSGRLRDRSEAARASNLHLSNLLRVSRALQSAARPPDVAAALEKNADPLVGARPTLFIRRSGGLAPVGAGGEEERALLAASVMEADEPVLRTPSLLAMRLDGAAGPLGAMVLGGADTGRINPAALHAFGNMVALAIERAELSERMEESRATARAEELKTALLSSVSHDFRTPLAAIAASASSLLAYGDRLDPATSAEFLRRIVEDCERLNRYTANLLEMSRLEAGDGSARPQTLSVAEMLGVAVQRVRGRAGDRTITVVADPDLLVTANPALFELVLINVLDNAILYGADGTRIILASRRQGEYCRISVADEGRGIPDADIDRVFERFYRVKRAEQSPGGSGLGLAIAKGFVEASGGTIEARTPGVDLAGAEIVIRLPLAIEAVTA